MILTPNQYQIVLKDANGVKLSLSVDAFSSVEYTRSVNTPGACKLLIADKDVINDVNNWTQWKIDGRVEFWKSLNGGPMYLDGDTVYFIRKPERDLNADMTKSMAFSGHDTIGLLNRRTTVPDKAKLKAYYNVTTLKEADDVLKDIWTNYFGSNADVVATAAYGNSPAGTGVGFDISALITSQDPLTQAQQITKKFPNANVLQVMQEIAQNSTQLGTYLAFDIVTDGDAFEFRTYANQRGQDRRASTGNALLIGTQAGNVLTYHYEDDHTNEATYLVSGQGTPVFSATREGVGPFGRIMKNIPAAASGNAAHQTAYSQSQLRYNRSKKLFTATMIQTEGCLYGKHYGYGDYVTVSEFGQQFDCHLDAVKTTLSGSGDVVECIFRGEYQAWL